LFADPLDEGLETSLVHKESSRCQVFNVSLMIADTKGQPEVLFGAIDARALAIRFVHFKKGF
jgi:hypothetical protein